MGLNISKCQNCKEQATIIRCWRCDYKVHNKKKVDFAISYPCKKCQVTFSTNSYKCNTCFNIYCMKCIDSHQEEHLKSSNI